MKYKIAAAILALIVLVLIVGQLTDFTAFAVGAPSGPLLSPELWEQIGQAVGTTLWSYRVIDVLVQVTLLLAAVVGASAMFRSMRKEES
ncbi:MAG: hypothetical protein ACP6IT_03645 [Candidatus Thorarchaeota archaeon]